MNSKLISGVTEFLNTEGELKEVNILRCVLMLFFYKHMKLYVYFNHLFTTDSYRFITIS